MDPILWHLEDKLIKSDTHIGVTLVEVVKGLNSVQQSYVVHCELQYFLYLSCKNIDTVTKNYKFYAVKELYLKIMLYSMDIGN